MTTPTHASGLSFARAVALLLSLALAPIGVATAQVVQPGAKGSAATEVDAKGGFDALKGTWIRPDGGYTIVIKGAGANGALEATYFNPKQLPFAKAQATRDGKTVRVFFELQAGGYNGSTYELTHDPASDRLNGIYYQAVVKQKFEVTFARK